jgi:hypothetical protein
MASVILVGACAELYHYQLSDIDSTQGTLVPVSAQVTSTGVDFKQIGKALELTPSSRQRERIRTAQDIQSSAQSGPATGNPTFTDTWADEVASVLLAQCPSGRITGVSAVREQRKYSAISGEIVTVKGLCIQ